LGIEISYRLDNIEEIFEKITGKIIDQAAYWERFRLTLPGRIAIAKTFLVSQLNYVGCFLKPSEQKIAEIQEILDNFVKKNFNIARSRKYECTDRGGLGMFNIKEFLASQRCMWINRAHKLQNDNWRYDLKLLSPGNNILAIRPCDIEKEVNPLMYEMVVGYRDFYGKFSSLNGNFKEAYIFDNPAVLVEPTFTGTINQSTFGAEFYMQNKLALRTLKFKDCFINGNFKSTLEFSRDGLPLTPAA
jgi:hypothetical protein